MRPLAPEILMPLRLGMQIQHQSRQHLTGDQNRQQIVEALKHRGGLCFLFLPSLRRSLRALVRHSKEF